MLMRSSFAVLLFLLFGSLPALADAGPAEDAGSPYARTGSYLLLGTSYIADAGFAADYKQRFDAGAKVDPAWALRIATGYRLADHLAPFGHDALSGLKQVQIGLAAGFRF